ncbi:response regulator [Anaeromyxobacter sp. Fw109-5]|uniref:response regulator n=1 Tax=Anaeromyxobacter sp. (strain Fw109-5) TaxID=404589 RepID=UPI0000ED6E55|nr:response regulator [Anaeromyxobacter sp. Fw109-5]ABS28595.1 response regulator receiver protein [Anaeromyxobacter sp. Fw109-5]
MRPKILLVDDNAELLSLLARLMEAEGWTPVSAGKGHTAIRKIAEEKPAAAVVDILLPDMMGYDVAHALRNAKVPFVFMTGVFKGGRASTDARSQHGAAAYFEKPFEARLLVQALRTLVPASTPAPARAPPPPPPSQASDFDVEVAVEADEPLEPMELTGKVVLTEDGKVSAVLRGEKVTAAPVGAPGRTPPRPPPVPARRAEPRPPPDLSRTEGKLADNLPDLITAFHLAQQTGELTVQKGKVKKTLYFEKGRPCFAISNLVTDRFGPFLVRVGKITTAQLEECQAEADRTGRRAGDILVELKLLKDTEKLYYVAQQVKAIVYSAFGWEEGEYRMHFADRAAQEAIKIDLHPANLIVRGVKKLYKPERLYRLLSPEERLIPSPQPAYGLHEVELERWEAEILPKVDGTRTVAELVHLSQRPEHVVYGFLYAMVALKLLDRTA